MSHAGAPQDLVKATRTIAALSIAFSILYACLVGVNQAWKLQTPEVIGEQWVAVAIAGASFVILLAASLVRKNASSLYHYGIGLLQVITYIALITFTIYTQRGMASTAIILYVFPILVAALSRATAAVFITASLCATTYCLAALKYFRDFPSEGYKVELYGQLFFYSVILLLIAGLVTTLLISKRSTR